MTPKTRKRSFPVKPEALRLMEEKMREKEFKFTTQEGMYEELSEKADLSPDTIKNVFHPEYKRPPGRNTVQSIARVLGLNPWDIVEGWNPPESSSRVKSTGSKVYIFNRETFQEMLDKQRELTANPLINANFEASKLYVPLGLVESKKQERRKDVSPEMGSCLYRPEEYEITRQFENDEFLTEVLLQGNSPKSQGKRIAIIGEPGSGKTTRLQQIADRIFNENDENLVIWVSLADLQDKNLEDFLLNTWLKIALKQREASEASQNELIEKFNEGNVWLLLDGLDEMVLDSNRLVWVNSQIHKINGWIESAKVILTCRVNVWESGNNYLSYFDVYKNLPFSELQRDKFIDKFFTDRNLADQLIAELNQDGNERIRDLVKNPLRLTLVCHSWKNHQGSLPKTKAGLYQEFVETFYLWKEVKSKTTSSQRKALNQALGELAKQALDQESSKFRLTKSFIYEVLGESDEGLFKMALDLGWLNPVGVAEENPDEQVYAFFHPSFQEYFAALAIGDNLDILENHIFQKNWQEIILLWIGIWIGRADINSKLKNEFIERILNFKDISHSEKIEEKINYNFYHNRAFLLAAQGLLEFDDCNQSSLEKIIDYLISIIYDSNFPIETFQTKLFDCLMKIGSTPYKVYLEEIILSKYNDDKEDDKENYNYEYWIHFSRMTKEEKEKNHIVRWGMPYEYKIWEHEKYFLITLMFLNHLNKNKYETEFFQCLNNCRVLSNGLTIASKLEKYDKESAINTLQKIIESKTHFSIFENCRDTKIDAVRYLFAFDPDNSREFCTNYLESVIKKIEIFIRDITKFNNHKDCNKYADDYRKYVVALGLLIKIHPYNNSYLEKLLDFIIIRQYGYDLDWDILFDISNNYSIDNQYIQKLEEISEENTLEMCPLFRVKIKYIILKISAEYTENRFIDYLEKVIEEENSKAELSSHSQDILLELCYALLKFKQNNIIVNETLKRLLFESEQSWIINRAIQYLPYNALNEFDLISRSVKLIT